MTIDPRVDPHIAKFSGEHRDALIHIRAQLREILPDADEAIKYNMPCFVVNGVGIAGFDAFKNHWSYFPMSGSVLNQMDDLPAWTETTTGTLRVPLDRRLTKKLVKQLIKVRLDLANQPKRQQRPATQVVT
jgi:uncharacterized protein YdhG (YjbR/CyaY superfamily)